MAFVAVAVAIAAESLTGVVVPVAPKAVEDALGEAQPFLHEGTQVAPVQTLVPALGKMLVLRQWNQAYRQSLRRRLS